MIDGWVHPGLVAGTALASVPILIHLLNRQRHKPMPWAAMRFVLLAHERTRRRARLEEWLLLLLRALAVLLLALAIARPFAGPQSPLAGLTESRRDLVLVVDASASTGYRDQVESVFERITARAREILLELDGSRGDRVRLVVCGAHPRLVAWRTPEEALSILGTLAEPFDEPLDLAASLAEVRGWVDEDAAGTGQSLIEVRLLSDLQRRSFVPEVGPGDEPGDAGDPGDPGADAASTGGPAVPAMFEELDRLAELGVVVVVEDHGPPDPTPANLTITSIEPLSTLLGPGLPFDVAVTVANHGPKLATGVRVALSEDGERRPSRSLEIPAGGSARAVFTVSFRQSGAHVVEAEIDSDRLPIDDQRAHVVWVPPPVRVLLVNGAPAAAIEEDEVGLLAAVLEPVDGDVIGAVAGARPFHVRAVPADELRDDELDLADHDVVVLANVEVVPRSFAERLERRIAEGAGLILTAGDRVDAERANELFWRPDGTGLLPAELGRRVAVTERRSNYWRVAEFDELHPALAFFADERWRPLLTEVPVYGFLGARPEPGARVLARLDDADHSPLLVAKDYDRGRVFLWTTTIDPAWTLFPEVPVALVPLWHELLRAAGSPPRPAFNRGVHDALVCEVDVYPQSPEVVRPDGSRRPLDGEPEALGPLRWRLPRFEQADRIGVYEFQLEGEPAVPFAVTLDPSEGDLDRLGPSELSQLHPALAFASVGGAVESDDRPVQGELWRGFAIATLILMFAESLWAAWLGRRRRAG